jgi:IS1 family transposase
LDKCKKKQKKVEHKGEIRTEEGDAWVYTCLKRHSYFFVAFAVGKWTQETCREMIFDLARRVELLFGKKRVQFFTDGNDDYTYILPDYFKTENMDYGQLIKIREKGRVIRKEKIIIFGSPDMEDIETTDVENFNSILRERIGRLVRKTKCFSKLKYRLKCCLQLFLFYWNFMSEIQRKVTPAMIEGLSDRIWTWHDFFYFVINYP